MTDRDRPKVLTDEQWAVLAPLIEASRPPHKTDHHDLRRTIEAIIWRHDSGAKWRQIPAALGPWWMAAQTFSRWSRLGAWERLLELAQQRGGVEAGMAFLDGTSIRAHHKAPGAAKRGALGAGRPGGGPAPAGAGDHPRHVRGRSQHHRERARGPRLVRRRQPPARAAADA